MNKQYIIMKHPDGYLTFTFLGDDRLETTFKDWEKFNIIDEYEHVSLINLINDCEWNKKIDIINGIIEKVDKYTPEEEAAINIAIENRNYSVFFNSEREIALMIESDYRLELEPITDLEMSEVKTYIKAIKTRTMATIHRPEIMARYDKSTKSLNNIFNRYV